MPCYNDEEFVDRAIQSVLEQTLRDFELIVVDDRSADTTLSRIKRFSDPRIRIIENQSNLGLTQNWEKALSCCVGKYVKLMGGDDWLHPDCLSRQVAILESPASESIVLAVCNRKVIGTDDSILFQRRLPFPSGRVSGKTMIRKSVRLGSNLIGEPVTGLFRRRALSGSLELLNPYVADLALWSGLLRCADGHIDPECLVAFRVSGKAASARIGGKQAACFRAFIRRMRSEEFFSISRWDALAGHILCYPWCFGRNAFMTYHFRGNRALHEPRLAAARQLANQTRSARGTAS